MSDDDAASWQPAGPALDARELTRLLDDHHGDHPKRERDCIVCAMILATVTSWHQHFDGDDPIIGVWRLGTPLDGDGPDTPLDE